MDRLQIQVLSYPHFNRIETTHAVFDLQIPAEQADGVLAYYFPDIRLLELPNKPRAWFQIEPRWHSMYRTPAGRRLLRALKPDELFWFGNADPRYRIPHPTHRGKPQMLEAGTRRGVVAVVSNFGGRLWFLHADFRLRNTFITHPRVELYGARASWARWRKWVVLGSRRAPGNYRGELAGDGWDYTATIQFLSQYHAALCLENSVTPFYFTEKFVNAVCAGCVPIYHAHSTVRETVLHGARWIDPQDYAFDPEATINVALRADRDAFNEANRRWLESPGLALSQERAGWERVGQLMAFKAGRASP